MKKLIVYLITVCLIISVAAAVQAESVTLSFNRDSLTLSVGRYVTVYVYISPSGAISDAVTYSVSDESVASVSSDGKVRALQAGECELTATSKSD